MLTRIILIRHGQSMANLEERFAGQAYDAELSPLGMEQAKLTAEYVAEKYSVDRIYASDLKRAYATARQLAAGIGAAEVVKAPGMREIYAGKWEGLKFCELDTLYAEEYSVWKNNIGAAKCNGGETVAELCERVLAAISDIAAENEDKTVAVATHATPIRALECIWKGKELADMCKIPWVSNASVTVAEYENGKFKMISVGYDGHLGNVRSALPKNV